MRTSYREMSSRPGLNDREPRLVCVWGIVCAMLLVAQAFTGARAQDAGGASAVLTVKGSDTMVILGQRWAEEFMKKNAGSKVQVMGGGSGTGIAALLNGSADIAEASRPMKPQETVEFIKKYHRKPQEIAVALDGIAIFVNKDNPAAALTLEQLRRIFRGEVRNWKELGGTDSPIILYGRDNSSGTYAFFKEHILKGLDFAAETQTLPGTAAIINAIGKDPKGIGYGGIGYSEGVKVLGLKEKDGAAAVQPTEENVDKGIYPLARNLYFYLDPEKNVGLAAQFIEFCKSPSGQAIVSEVGYYPLKSKPAPVADPGVSKQTRPGQQNPRSKKEGTDTP